MLTVTSEVMFTISEMSL